MPKLTNRERQLLVEEIQSQIKSNRDRLNLDEQRDKLPLKDRELLADIEAHIINISTLRKQKEVLIKELGKELNMELYSNSNIESYVQAVLSKRFPKDVLPTQSEIERAIMFSEGGKDMSALVKAIVKQFSKQ